MSRAPAGQHPQATPTTGFSRALSGADPDLTEVSLSKHPPGSRAFAGCGGEKDGGPDPGLQLLCGRRLVPGPLWTCCFFSAEGSKIAGRAVSLRSLQPRIAWF